MKHGNDRLRRFGAKALLLGFLVGGGCALEARFQKLRLMSLSLTPWNQAMENTLYRNMPSTAQRFWPLSILYFRACRERLEASFPIEIDTSIRSWGNVVFSYKPREAFLRIKWKDRLWTLSTDGRIWPQEQDLEPQKDRHRLPVIAWSEDLPPAFTQKDDVVHEANLPIPKIKLWLQEISQVGWEDTPLGITVRSRAGGMVLQLRRQVSGTDFRLILPEDTVRWPQIFQALEEISTRLTGQEKWVQIDATYCDKIVVKRDIL